MIMKKTFIALAFIAAGAFAFNANAANTKNDKQVCENKTECCKKDNKECGRKDRMAKAFEGIQLTEQQQTALNALNAKRAEARKAKAAERKNGKEVKNANTDKTARADKQQERMNARLAYLKEVQKILTPDQYITFLENTAISAPHGKMAAHKNGPKHDKKGRNGKDRKGGHDRKDGQNGKSDRRNNRS